MAKSPDATDRLTDAEKRDLIEGIQVDKPLPEKYRFLLFVDIIGNDTMALGPVTVG